MQNDFRTVETDDEQAETNKGAANRGSAAPAQLVSSPQQGGENYPGQHGEEGFMQNALPGKDIVDKKQASDNACAKQQHSEPE